MSLSYKDAGVCLQKADDFIKEIKPIIKQSYTPGVLGELGGFAGGFELPSGYENPVLMAACDGVGSKLKLAIKYGFYENIGEDLVAMCVNDLLCSFAKPLFFLDYYAANSIDIEIGKQILTSIVNGCKKAKCALIGGESAEMPVMYAKGDFDLAGFCVGVAEKSELCKQDRVKNGDLLLALPSSGLHSNGYALATKVLFEVQKRKFDDMIEGRRLIDILLEPTRIYADDFATLLPWINAAAHITGGGIINNLPRVLPKGLGATLSEQYLKAPAIFKIIAKDVEREEMAATFNLGVGMILVVSPQNVSKVLQNSDAYILGELSLNEKVSIQ